MAYSWELTLPCQTTHWQPEAQEANSLNKVFILGASFLEKKGNRRTKALTQSWHNCHYFFLKCLVEVTREAIWLFFLLRGFIYKMNPFKRRRSILIFSLFVFPFYSSLKCYILTAVFPPSSPPICPPPPTHTPHLILFLFTFSLFIPVPCKKAARLLVVSKFSL